MLSRPLEFCSSIAKTKHFSVSLGMVNITMTDVSPCAVHLVVSFFLILKLCIIIIATQKLGCHGVVHILDGFLLIEKTQTLCEKSLSKFQEFCSEVGFLIAFEKKRFSQVRLWTLLA